MKKRLEAELISIAHRVLKLKNRAEINQLYTETRKLYEVLSVLKFVDDNIDVVHPKIDVNLVEEKIEMVLNTESDEEPRTNFEEITNQNDEVEVIESTENEDFVEIRVTKLPEVIALSDVEIDNKIEPDLTDEKIDDTTEIAQDLTFEKVETPIAFEKVNHPVVQQISFEELLGHQFEEPVFEKKEEIISNLNDKIGRDAIFGLNDKIGFVTHLFDDSEEDFNRVVSQIGTFDTFVEVQNFVDTLVKPDYNNWEGKTDYEKRFMFFMQRKFL